MTFLADELIKMVANKKRLYIALYPSGVTNNEERKLSNVRTTASLLARVLIAKIDDEKRLVEIMRGAPVVQDNPNWHCRTWVADVLSRLAEDGRAVGTAKLGWGKIEAQARQYVAEKTAAGRYGRDMDADAPRPTWDMLDEREVVP